MTPVRLTAHDPAGPLLSLIRVSFAFMDGRVDPPSSMHRLDETAIARQLREGEIWLTGTPETPSACAFLTQKPGRLYLGKLAVAQAMRGRGLARALIDTALGRARDLGLPFVELQTRVELTENHAAFAAMGFTLCDATAHPGYDRPTSLTFRRPA